MSNNRIDIDDALYAEFDRLNAENEKLAITIDTLLSENARLREALQEITRLVGQNPPGEWEAWVIARAALGDPA